MAPCILQTTDTNSTYMAKFCFSLGMALKRIEVIGDDEEEIIEATRRMSNNYDFVVTSGGIGPTCAYPPFPLQTNLLMLNRHDDITYQSIAKAFNLRLKLHEKAWEKMKKISKPHKSQPNFSWDKPSAALTAKLRMVELPIDETKSDEEQVLFVSEDLWVPISVVNGNVHILPGVPRLFEALLDGMKPLLLPRLTDPEGKGIYRVLFSTPLAESAVAPYLSELAAKVEPEGVKVGSYPRWGKAHNTVTLVGRNKEFMDSLIPEVEKGVEGRRVINEEDDDSPSEAESKGPKDP